MNTIKNTTQKFAKGLFNPDNKLSLIPNWLSFSRVIGGLAIPIMTYTGTPLPVLFGTISFLAISDFLDGKAARIIAKEETVDDLNSIYEGLPYLLNNEENKIYIPSFPLALNFIYADEPMKLNEHPYDELRKDFTASLIDPFDEYGFHIYDSLFSRLLKVAEKDEIAFFYHVDFSNIYIINDQGRLDAKICLFDKYMHHINKNGMVERIKPIIDAYNADDKKSLIDALLTQDLISGRMHHLIYKKERKFKRNQFRLKKEKR